MGFLELGTSELYAAVNEVTEGRLSESGLSATIGQARTAPPAPMFADPSIIISRFQASHGFSTWPSTNGADDTSEKILGAQSARVDLPAGSTSTITVTKTIPALDMTNRAIRLWVKAELPAEVNLVGVRLGTDGSNYFAVNSPSIIPVEDDWRAFTVVRSDFYSTVGAPDWTNITYVRITVAGTSTNTGTAVWLNGIEVVDEPTQFPNGVLTLDWDDNYASVWDYAKPEMDARGMRGGIYVICDTVGSGSSYMTLDQLRELQETGWGVHSHSYKASSHSATFPAMSLADVDADLAACRDWLRSNGFRDGHFMAYPGGQNNAEIRRIADRYFTASRTTKTFPRQEYPPVYPQRLSGLPVSNTTTVSQIQEYVDRVRDNALAGHLIFHRVEDVASGAASNSIAIALPDLIAVLDYIVAQGVPVRTMREIYGPRA